MSAVLQAAEPSMPRKERAQLITHPDLSGNRFGYTIKGTLNQCLEEIETLLIEYPATGYDTFVKLGRDEDKPDHYEARVTRTKIVE